MEGIVWSLTLDQTAGEFVEELKKYGSFDREAIQESHEFILSSELKEAIN